VIITKFPAFLYEIFFFTSESKSFFLTPEAMNVMNKRICHTRKNPEVGQNIFSANCIDGENDLFVRYFYIYIYIQSIKFTSVQLFTIIAQNYDNYFNMNSNTQNTLSQKYPICTVFFTNICINPHKICTIIYESSKCLLQPSIKI